MVEEGPHREARETVHRAIRRLNVLEYVILIVVVLLSMAGGALLAFLANSLVGVPFRITWAVASVLIFVIPAAIVWGKEVRVGGGSTRRGTEEDRKSDEHG